MGETVDSSVDFKLDPIIVDQVKENISTGKFLGYVREFDFDILMMTEGNFKVEVLDVEAGEFRASRERMLLTWILKVSIELVLAPMSPG